MRTATSDSSAWPRLNEVRTGPLVGVKVLDLSAFAVGPWATTQLAHLGADVIKIEPPHGDGIRMVRPTRLGEPTTYTVCNLGKRSVALNLKSADGLALALALAGEADVVVENSRAGAMDRLGIGHADVAARNPGVVYCSSSSFGHLGPMAGMGSTDPQGQAMSGFASLNGRSGERPQMLRYSALVDLTTSLYLVDAALAGLVARQRTGLGCHLLTSQMEAAVAAQTTRVAEYLATDEDPIPQGSGTAAVVPSGAFRCLDGRYLAVTASSEEAFARLCVAIGEPKASVDPCFATNRARLLNRAACHEMIAVRIGERPLAWWSGRLSEQGVAAAPFLTVPEAMDHVAIRDNRHMVRVPHPVRGSIASGGLLWSFGRTPAAIHQACLPGDLELATGGQAKQSSSTGPASKFESLADLLSGLKVLDVSQGIAGPACTAMLVALGADVTLLKPTARDSPHEVDPLGPDSQAAADAHFRRGKRLEDVDISLPAGRQRMAELLSAADVLVHDLDPSITGTFGLDSGKLTSRYPWLVHCGIAPLATHGEWAGRPVTELEVQALSGLTSFMGVLGEEPIRIGADIAAMATASAGLQAIAAALFERERSGLGQNVTVTHLGTLMALASIMLAALDRPDEWEGFHCLAATNPPDHGILTQDGSVLYGQPLRSEEAWQRFCRIIGAEPLLEDTRFLTRQARQPRLPEMRRALAPYFSRYTTDQVMTMIAETEGTGAPMNTFSTLFSHPQAEAMGLLTTDSDGGRHLAPPWRLAPE